MRTADRPTSRSRSAARSAGGPARSSGWTLRQRKIAVMAARSAGWNDAQRYLAMRACGCPDTEVEGRPSVGHPRNLQGSFEQLMALAESCAASTASGSGLPDISTPASTAEPMTSPPAARRPTSTTAAAPSSTTAAV